VALKLFNTLTRKKQVFKPLKSGKVGIYSCGPTVYDHTHLGHMRAYTFVSTLRRVLEYNNYQVKQVMNITDVGHLTDDADAGEDKVEKAARKKKISAWEIVEQYSQEFFEVMSKLNIKRPTIVCKATKHIAQMIEMIKKIEANGFAYRTSDGIYFDTSKLPDYGKLAHMPLDKLIEGARVEPNPEKKNPTDFALWKFSPQEGPKRQMEWDSPWGVGFPGWHIECSAMSTYYLGPLFDIHTGGVDHITVHHPNEMAQTEAAYGTDQARFWLHNEFVLVDGRKMSKSLGNFLIAKDLEERGFDLLAARYLFLMTHYRKPLNFTWDSLKSASRAFTRLKRLILELNHQVKRKAKKLSSEALGFKKEFLAAVNDDLNTAEGLAILWRVLESDLAPEEKLALAVDFDLVLGLRLAQADQEFEIPEKVKRLIAEREELRARKKWTEADQLRKKIEAAGFEIQDTKEGTKIWPKMLVDESRS